MTLEASSSKAEPELTALARLTLAYARGERGEEVDELIEPLRALRVGTPLASAAWVFAHALEAIRDDDPTREEALAEVASGNSVVARLAARAALHASSTPAPASPFYSLAEFSEASEASEASSPFEAELPVLLIDAEGAAFEFEGERVDLRRRRVLRLVLRALAESPEPIGVHELFEKGWPGVELHPEHAVQRVYWAIQELRKLGLRDVITTLDEGYTLSGARIEILI